MSRWNHQDIFTESNFRLFFGLALDVLVRPWEKFVMALKYSEVGIPPSRDRLSKIDEGILAGCYTI